jgi:hypothetical protein
VNVVVSHACNLLCTKRAVLNVLLRALPCKIVQDVRAAAGKVVAMDGTASVRIARDLGGLELIEAVHHRPNFPRHSHPTYAIGVVRAGANRFRYRGAFHTAPAGTLCTVTPDEAHSVEPAGDHGFAYWCLYPSLELVTGTAEAVGGKRPPGTLALPPVIEDTEAARLLCAVFEAEAATAPRMARETRLLALLSHVLVRHATASVVVRREACVRLCVGASARHSCGLLVREPGPRPACGDGRTRSVHPGARLRSRLRAATTRVADSGARAAGAGVLARRPSAGCGRGAGWLRGPESPVSALQADCGGHARAVPARGFIVTSTPAQRRAWLEQVRAMVARHFPCEG